MIDMPKRPTPKQLRWFGVIMFVFFSAVAGAVCFKLHARAVAFALVGVGAVFALLFYAVRALRVPMYLAWMRVFFPVGWLVSNAIVAVIYYLIVTPIGLIMRLVGRDPMRRRFDRNAGTYWVALRRNDALSQYFRQY